MTKKKIVWRHERIHMAIIIRHMLEKHNRGRSEKAFRTYAEKIMVSILRCKPEEIAAAIVDGVSKAKARNISEAIKKRVAS